MQKPRLTNRVLRGIIAGLVQIEAGDPEANSMTKKDWQEIMSSLTWAENMLNYRQRVTDTARVGCAKGRLP